MKQTFQGWEEVARKLLSIANGVVDTGAWLNDGQRASLRSIAERIEENGVIIADEVGMGKTRIAVATARAVIESGGRVAILVPSGLGFQWREELLGANIHVPPLLRSLLQYLTAWDSDEPEDHQPWFDQNAVIISHSFANWRLGDKAEPWRWALVPELYARWRKRHDHRFPPNFHDNEKLAYEWPRNAAKSIDEAIAAATDDLPRRLINELVEGTTWSDTLDSVAYRRHNDLRPSLERAVGLGLGVFDMVIIDEAHKSRNSESVLSSLTDRVVLRSNAARRLAMTATPVELNVKQWKDILERIGVDNQTLHGVIDDYENAVTAVRQTPLEEGTREKYKAAAARFQSALGPYLLRRDKRESKYVQTFSQLTKEPLHAYRREGEILIDTPALKDPAWKQAVCAAEALSVVTHQGEDSRAKRLRLTFGNGHGIAALLRAIEHDIPEDHDEDPSDASAGARNNGNENSVSSETAVVEGDNLPAVVDKRAQRTDWWMQVLSRVFHETSDPLFDHPAIVEAVKAIEAVSEHSNRSEKVLVFGRFTRPMQALVDLLNARALLRCLDAGEAWPQAKLHDDDWPAVQAAHRQMGRSSELTRENLDQSLAEQYGKLEQRRDSFRGQLVENIEAGLTDYAPNGRAMRIFNAFKKSVSNPKEANDGTSPLSLVSKAVFELMGAQTVSFSPKEVADAFVDLIEASADREEGDSPEDREFSEADAARLWEALEERIAEEFNRPQGGFARLMYGRTKLQTRRLLQLAFNREQSFPKVLVAQSMVGREGLNLHKSCKTVVLLHPEWNPGVVEQQIGRVDRVSSLWERRLDEAVAQGNSAGDLPRIDIRPVVFKGTYDERNWHVLRERWDDLRAQLHGVVISPLTASKSAIPPGVVDELNDAAPRFSPLR
jgi:superfamily II DNA or RNA helicase